MCNMADESLRLVWIEESIKGLATMTEIFKSGYLEQDYWNKNILDTHKDTREICQTIVTSLNGIAEQVEQIRHSIEEKEHKEGVAA